MGAHSGCPLRSSAATGPYTSSVEIQISAFGRSFLASSSVLSATCVLLRVKLTGSEIELERSQPDSRGWRCGPAGHARGLPSGMSAAKNEAERWSLRLDGIGTRVSLRIAGDNRKITARASSQRRDGRYLAGNEGEPLSREARTDRTGREPAAGACRPRCLSGRASPEAGANPACGRPTRHPRADRGRGSRFCSVAIRSFRVPSPGPG